MPAALTLLAAATGASACGTTTVPGGGAQVQAVGAESQYADVISQVGGRYVNVTSVMSNPNTDPHEFEASAKVASRLSEAQLVVQNGLGYDGFMDKLENAVSPRGQYVVVAAQLVRPRPGTFDPHLWYQPGTMALVARAVARDLARLQPAHRAYFAARADAFVSSLAPLHQAVSAFAAGHPGTPVAVTEPVADFLLQSAGARVLTPASLQTAVMNGTDPSPQDVAFQDRLLSRHLVRALLYNEQVTDAVTSHFLAVARAARIPVVAVYETMPQPGYNYQSWMLAEVHALSRAVASGISTTRL